MPCLSGVHLSLSFGKHFLAHYLLANIALIVGLAVKGGCYVTEIKMLQSNPG